MAGSDPPLERPPGRSAAERLPAPRAALVFVAVVAVLFFWGGFQLQLLLGEAGLPLAEWLLLFTPALIWIAASGLDPLRVLSLRTPRVSHLTGASLLVAGALPLGWLVGWLQTFVLPVPWEVLEGLEELVTADSPARLAWLLFALAATPAICEEVVFRGVLLAGTRELSPWRMVLLNGVVFGAFHLSLSTVVRFLPTALLGCVIAWAVWRTGSIWVGVVMHFFNNATIVALASAPALGEAFSDPRTPPPVPVLVAAGIAFAIGLRILLRTPLPSRGESTTPVPDP